MGIDFAKYRPLTNNIEIYHPAITSSVNHELLHLASYNSETKQIGLTHYNPSINENIIGEGLNEAYTELLNHRYFNSKSINYLYLRQIAELIELFYENKKDLEADYFHTNFYNLVAHLTKSMSESEALSLIIDIDYLYYYQADTKYFKNLKNTMYELYSQKHSKEEKEKFRQKSKIK